MVAYTVDFKGDELYDVVVERIDVSAETQTSTVAEKVAEVSKSKCVD